MSYAYRVPFIDRRAELEVLEREYRAGGFSLVVVYGRRRVGKTRLLREFIDQHGGVYYVASELTYPQIVQEFSRAVYDSLGYLPRGRDLVEILEELAGLGGRTVVVIDEFQYVVEAEPSLPSRLQRSVDGVLGNSRLMLVLCGSAISFFEKRLLGYRAPLYGRRTATIRLRPMRFAEAYGFLRELGPLDAVRVYSILGGTPAYLAYAYGAKSLREVVERVLSPGSPLIDEAEGLLRQELREPRRYMALLRAVAEGRASPYEAAVAAGIDPRTVHRYFEILEELDIVELRRPLGFRRGTRVFFRDDYYRFWFTYVLPYRHALELGRGLSRVAEHVLRTIDSYAAQTFQRIVEDHLQELHMLGAVPTEPLRYGPWWHRGEEIDIVVVNPGESASFLEVKWSDLSLDEARRAARRLRAKASHTGLQERVNHYVVIAKSIPGLSEPVMSIGEGSIAVDFSEIFWGLLKAAGAEGSSPRNSHG